jgi:hypothetical protein
MITRRFKEEFDRNKKGPGIIKDLNLNKREYSSQEERGNI